MVFGSGLYKKDISFYFVNKFTLCFKIFTYANLLYRSFVTYRFRFSQVFSYTIEMERFARKLCNFIISNYIQTLLEIGTIVLPLHT